MTLAFSRGRRQNYLAVQRVVWRSEEYAIERHDNSAYGDPRPLWYAIYTGLATPRIIARKRTRRAVERACKRHQRLPERQKRTECQR